MKIWQKLLAIGLGLALLAGSSLPQAAQALPAGKETRLAPRWVPTKPAHTEIMDWESREVIEVKFAEGSGFRMVEGAMTAQNAEALTALQAVFNAHAVRSVERMFTQPEQEFEAEKGELEAAIQEQLPDLNLWYRVRVPEGGDPEALIDSLNALSVVEIAYPAPLPAPPPSYAADSSQPAPALPSPSYVAQQGYLNPATAGVDAKYAWPIGGGTGANVNIIDIEYSFNSSHEDLPTIPVIGGQMWNGYGDDHGTAVWGELVAERNSFGVTGIAYGAHGKFSSACMNSSSCDFNPANAINSARTGSLPGDVILLEQQTGVCGTSSYGPLEWIQSVYDATKVATAANRIVVAAAGNGNVNLDGAGCSNKFNRSTRDSGAIIVGAGAAPTSSQTDRSRLSFSSYGSRVDVQGWGGNVYTTGYGDQYAGTGKNQWYTNSFSGTSSASPIVTGAAALLSSISQQRGKVQTPLWIRSTLATTGSPQQAHAGYPVSEKIGPRPDLKKAIQKLERPVPVSPSGTITDPTPTYKWNRVPGATKYNIVVYEGTTSIYGGVFTSGICNATTCSVTPSNVLTAGNYKWRVRAYIGSSWKSFSAWKTFTDNPPESFNSSFNGSAAGWSAVKGSWGLYSGMYYRSLGLANRFATAKHTGTYENFTYEARIKRSGACTGCANNLIIRGNPGSLAVNYYAWRPSYYFEYTNNGYFSVWEMSNGGTETSLKNWTTTGAIVKNGWNNLKVIANGNSLKFYINNVLVWSGSDSTLANGTVGLGFYRDTNTGTYLADWAKLTIGAPDEVPGAVEEVAPGIEVPGGTIFMAPDAAP